MVLLQHILTLCGIQKNSGVASQKLDTSLSVIPHRILSKHKDGNILQEEEFPRMNN